MPFCLIYNLLRINFCLFTSCIAFVPFSNIPWFFLASIFIGQQILLQFGSAPIAIAILAKPNQ